MKKMTIKNDNYSYSLDFFGKECKNNYHNQCASQWQGFGFQIVCKCECHGKKIVLGKYEALPNTLNSPLRGMENMCIIIKIPKDKDFFPKISSENTNDIIVDGDEN